ncbi:unnamed protein product [Rotaria magnacalcarata]|uniref:BTB domain-containing protein n=2 Tax=Rotaria magnacalcarata TaxID=392030 RepID=A0A817A334_9BILA|nr:unnamed protein product [Rotaria magnacalcarata]CAF1322932.1 unnamed protein product [Rotaria magnacalcarata]CAF2240426.1 unnamed protein product [Rotaria magnacalcarata]CAF3771312.1 unnamed protein product [Rotaria magnacalcarata]CAF3800711.1 unnamed protein product [Rotaria magnacalcarata]
MSKYAHTINSFCTKSEKYTNEIRLENFGLLRRMYSNYLTTEIYEHWNWSWSYMIQPTYQESKFRIVVQFNNLPLTPGHLLAFKAILFRKNSQTTKSSECICLKEHLWLTENLNILEVCSLDELDQFIYKDTLRIVVIVRHDWLVKELQTDEQILSITSNAYLPDSKIDNCNKKYLEDMKSIVNQIETSDVTIRCRNQTYKCHRAILSARSSYFHSLFNSNFSEKFQDEIDLSSFLTNNNDFDLLHSYVYKAEINLTLDNILQYIQLSDKFLLDDLYELCEQFLLNDNHINESNVWNILDIYSTIGRKISLNIQEKCFHVLKNNRHLINEECHDLLKRHPHLSIELVKYFV